MTSLVLELPGLDDPRLLSECWQRRPALIRGATLPRVRLSGDELAGLALEEEVESRLIGATATADDPEASFSLRHGPFEEADFTTLPERNWTLLVHGLDHWHKDLNALSRAFPALPRWRLDDVMASYAAPGGGVGPHLDRYDVFLIQHSGRRRWRLGAPGAEQLRAEQPLALLQQFEVIADWVLEPGDILYLPPGVPHWGTAIDDCITLSVGFRAPSSADLADGLAASLQAVDAPLLADPGRAAATDPAAITPADIARVRQLLTDLLADDALLAEALGCAVTEPTRAPAEPVLPAPKRALHPSTRVAYWESGDHTLMFLDGASFRVPLELARALAAGQISSELARRYAAILAPLADAGAYRP